jgi:molybdopterin converting factor small subunit
MTESKTQANPEKHRAALSARVALLTVAGRWHRLLAVTIEVSFYSYFRELTGASQATEEVAEGCTLGELHRRLIERFPKLDAMRRSTLLAVGVEYQGPDYPLRQGDEVSLFPPVQGG